MPQTVPVEITAIAASGAGVGRLPDGRAVFVHRTAPGELVDARITEERPRWARASLVRVRRPAPERRPAPCPHYERCGGCTLEHLRYDAQLRAKSRIVTEAVRRIGKTETPEPEVVPSPEEFRYRNRVSFTLLRLGHGRVIAGFHELERPGRILDITERCLLPEPAIAAAWGRLRTEWGPNADRLPSGHRLRLTLRASAAGAVSLLVEGGYASGAPDELLARTGLTALWHRPAGAPEPRLLAGEPAIRETWLDEELPVTGAVFLQVNRAAAARLEEHLLERAGNIAGLRVIDAYCGAGTRTRRLARLGARVTGIERDPQAIAAARAQPADGAEFLLASVEDALPTLLPADLVILNPPRSGLHPAIPEALRNRPPRRILYVSCDPATLARDLARLQPAFTLASLRCFDLFPQTAHVETVADLPCATP